MIFLEYNFEVVYVLGKRLIVADYLSKDTNATKEGINNSLNEFYIQMSYITVEDLLANSNIDVCNQRNYTFRADKDMQDQLCANNRAIYHGPRPVIQMRRGSGDLPLYPHGEGDKIITHLQNGPLEGYYGPDTTIKRYWRQRIGGRHYTRMHTLTLKNAMPIKFP